MLNTNYQTKTSLKTKETTTIQQQVQQQQCSVTFFTTVTTMPRGYTNTHYVAFVVADFKLSNGWITCIGSKSATITSTTHIQLEL